MSTKSPAELEADETAQIRAQWEQFSFRVDAPGMVEVTNESHDNPQDHQYVVTLDDVTGDAIACTCPHYVHRSAFCKHMAGAEDAIADGSLDVFPSKESNEDADEPRVTGPHIGFDKYGNADHRYWRCENCGIESTEKRALGDCC